ncbi:MAG: AAA family ATPase [Chloroflexi bacterium]|nr:AAA family ATPase [Chloroflexota bacterium]
MNCPSCGTPSDPGRKFCAECGTRLSLICPSCAGVNAAAARFCGECGTRLSADLPGVAGTAASPASAPANAAPVAERRLVTVLFADLVGFTSLAEGRDAEAVRELLTRYFELARDVIERYGGTVEKFIGDAVMAVWGAPVAHEDDAERGVRAGLELVDAVHSLGPGIQARAGVLTGEAAVTLGARDQGMVAGDLVNTASRLQSVAAPGKVLVGEATHRASSGAIAFEPAGDQVLKGKEAPVAAWVALRVVSKRKGLGRSDRLEAPFVGRDSELRLLKDLFHATTRESRVRLVSITGQAGIGKSRLAWEFLKYVDGVVEGVWWHDGRSPAYGEGVTFWALGEMIRSRAGLLDTDDVETTRAKVAAMVAEHVPDEAERVWIEPAMLALLGAGEAPAGGRDELFRAWRTFFERLSATGIVGLLFEDLHWADAGLLDFIDYVLEWSRGVPILIITLARPELLERRPDWGAGRRNFLALGLEPLTEPAMRELLAGLVPGLPPATTRSIIERADGIPLYAVETIRMLLADGRLREVDGHYEPAGELGELAVPETLQALIAARLDGLDPADRTLLQDAAVLGQSFTLAGLAAVSGEEPAVLEGRLHALQRLELIDREVDPRSPERGMYGFVQALIREVAYGTLARRDRRARHLAAARFFESLDDDELAGALASHYVAAWQSAPEGPEGDAVAIQARLALVGAADRALKLGSPEGAIGFFEQALTVVTDPSERAPILERAGRAAAVALQPDRAQALLREAIDVRRAMADKPGTFRAIAALGAALITDHRLEAAGTLLEPAVAEAEGAADDVDLATLVCALARVRFSQDRIDEGLALIDRGLPIAERDELHELLTEALITKGSLLSKAGRPVEGIALCEAARRIAVEHGLPAWEGRALVSLSLNMAIRDPRAAMALEREAIALARRIGQRAQELLLIGNAGEDSIRTGEWDWQAAEFASLGELEIEPAIRLPMEASSKVIGLFRGTVDPDEIETRYGELVRNVEDVDVASSDRDMRGWLALANGRFAEASAAWLENAALSSLNAPYVLPRAAHMALLAGDAATARLALDRLVATGAHGRALDVDRTAVQAGLAALEGRRAEAIAGYRAVPEGLARPTWSAYAPSRSSASASSVASAAIAVGWSAAASASTWARVVTPVSMKMQRAPTACAAARSVPIPSPIMIASLGSRPTARAAASNRYGAGLPMETGTTPVAASTATTTDPAPGFSPRSVG